MKKAAPLALLITLTILSYAPALRAGFIWDDDAHVTANPTLRSVEGLAAIWTRPALLPQYYPLVHTTFWLEYHAWKLDPRGYHAVNVLLQAVNACLLWLLLARLEVPGALFAAALFAVHPVQVESVAWITERKNLLSTCFYLLAFLKYLECRSLETTQRRARVRAYAFCLAAFACALLSKTVACSLPAALLVVHWWKQGRVSRRDIAYTAPMFVLGVAFAVSTAVIEAAHVGATGDEWGWTAAERVLIAGRAVWFYAAKLLWPANLTFIYPQWTIDGGAWAQWLFPAGAVAVLAVAWLAKRRVGRGPLASMLLFGGTLVPALGFINLYPMRYSFVADHFQYVASIALLTFFAAAIWTGMERWSPPARRAASVACGSVVVLLSALTFAQARVYANAATLWEDTLRKNPACWMAHGNLASLLAAQGRGTDAAPHFAIALEHFVDVVRRHPGSAQAHRNLAAALMVQGRRDEAREQFAEAVALDPRDYGSQNYLGVALSDRGEDAAALVHLARAVEINPRFAQAHFNLANVLFKEHRMSEAEEHYRAAVSLNPFDVEATSNFGVLLLDTGRPAEARQRFQRAIDLAPENLQLYRNLALAWSAEKHYREALDIFRELVRLNPADTVARQKMEELDRLVAR